MKLICKYHFPSLIFYWTVSIFLQHHCIHYSLLVLFNYHREEFPLLFTFLMKKVKCCFHVMIILIQQYVLHTKKVPPPFVGHGAYILADVCIQQHVSAQMPIKSFVALRRRWGMKKCRMHNPLPLFSVIQLRHILQKCSGSNT